MKVFSVIYVIAAAVIALLTTFLQVQPALLWIDLMAPNPGDTFDIKLVFLLTFLLLLGPYIIIAIIMFFKRRSSQSKVVIGEDKTGVWIKRKSQLQSALVGISVYIDGKKEGVVDIGPGRFFETIAGTISVQVGEGKSASEKLDIFLAPGQKQKLELAIKQNGLTVKYELTKV